MRVPVYFEAVQQSAQQPAAALREQRPDEQLDERFLVGDQIGQPVTSVERRGLLERRQFLR